MKRTIPIFALILAAAVLSSCEHGNIFYPIECEITPDRSNSYLAGEEIVFDFDKPADFITFYSGEDGRQYPDGTPEVVKNAQNDLAAYSYTYSYPGTYVLTFVLTNENYMGSDRRVQQFQVTIWDNPDYAPDADAE